MGKYIYVQCSIISITLSRLKLNELFACPCFYSRQILSIIPWNNTRLLCVIYIPYPSFHDDMSLWVLHRYSFFNTTADVTDTCFYLYLIFYVCLPQKNSVEGSKQVCVFVWRIEREFPCIQYQYSVSINKKSFKLSLWEYQVWNKYE